nr:PASTA domain-containing protein [Actinomycetota bacterium]
ASSRDGRAADERATEPAAEQSEAYELVNLTGWNAKEAEKVLEDQGFDVAIEEVPHEQPKDTVLETEPPPGTGLSPGDTVTLIVSTGKVEDDDDSESEEPEEGPPGQSGEPPGHSKDKDKEED